MRPRRTLRVGAACVREAPQLRMADGRPAVRMRRWRRRRHIASSKVGARLRRVRVHVRACVQLRVRAWPPLQQRCRIAAAWFERRRRGVILSGGVCLAEVAMDSGRCECGGCVRGVADAAVRVQSIAATASVGAARWSVAVGCERIGAAVCSGGRERRRRRGGDGERTESDAQRCRGGSAQAAQTRIQHSTAQQHRMHTDRCDAGDDGADG